MSNVTVFNASKAPSFAKSRGLSTIAKSLTGGGAASGKNISIK